MAIICKSNSKVRFYMEVKPFVDGEAGTDEIV